jgi:hypothetical protein
LWTDTGVSEEHTAFIFKVELCRFRNRVGEGGDSRRGAKNRNPPTKLHKAAAQKTAIKITAAVT